MIEAKAFRTFIRACSLFRSEQLSTNIKLILHKALFWLMKTYAYSAWESVAEIAAPAKEDSCIIGS
jgi:hypothetical protein